MTNKEFIARWLKGQTKHEQRHQHLLVEGDSIFSYGRHFKIAKIDRDRKLIIYWNPDKYSMTTTRHQSMVSSALATHGYREKEHG